jgi:hypothetical protein
MSARPYVKFFMTAKAACVQHSTDAPLVAVVAYGKGYYPIYTDSTPERLNPPDMTPDILEAAHIGSMFGWDVPGAKPAVDYIRKAEGLA